MSKLKTPLVVAGVSCVLSMLIGMISGVRFVNIIIRGLTAGVGAGCFVFCARMLLEKFIPDLFMQQISPETGDTSDSASGTNVNITLDEGSDVPVAGETENIGMAASTVSEADGGDSREEFSVDAPLSDSGASTVNSDLSDAAALSVEDTAKKPETLSGFPDMGDFMESGTGEDAEEVISSTGGGFSVSGIQTPETDSKVMAQAIRTILVTED